MIHTVGLKGGPCGGKTTAIEVIKERAEGYGINVLLIPEVATRKLGALSVAEQRATLEIPERRLCFQEEVLVEIIDSIVSAQEAARNLEISQPDAKILIIADRVDVAPYMTTEDYVVLREKLGFLAPPMNSLVNKVIFLPTIAKTNPAKYLAVKSTNATRYESVDEAVAQCDRNLRFAKQHPDFWIVAEEDEQVRMNYAANIALLGLRSSREGVPVLV